MADLSPRKPVTFKHAVITGLVALFPLVVTIVLLKVCWDLLEKFSQPVRDMVNGVVTRITGYPEPSPWIGTLVSLILAVLVVYVLGVLIAGIIGRRLVAWTDHLFGRLPIVRYIYPHAKQLSDFLFGKRNVNFSRVVVVEYPRKGVYSMGFATSKGIEGVSRKLGRKMIAVFIPTSPTPFTGWTILVDESEVMYPDMSVDEAVRFAISCGVIIPGEEPPPGLELPGQLSPPGEAKS